MRTWLRGKMTLLFLTIAVLIAIPAVGAIADTIAADADFVTANNQSGTNPNPIDMGKVKAGGSVSKQVSFQLVCAGNNHVNNGQTVTLDATPGTTGVPTGGSVQATAATIGPIPLSWPDDGNACPSPAPTPIEDNGNTTVTFNAPSTATNGTVYDFSVNWGSNDVTLAPAASGDSNSVTGNTQVFFRVTVDAQAPDTVIDTGPSGTVNSNSATFTYHSTEANSTFETRLDNGSWESNGTSTSKTYNSLSDAPHTFDVRATDPVGNTDASPASRSWTVQTDSTGPEITANVVGTLGDNGWYTSNVSVSWTVTDPESTVTSQTGCGSSSVTSDTNGTTFTCSATSAGGTSSQSVTIKRDATAPTINGTRSPGANANGWNNTDVTVNYTCSDSSTPGSGLASGACPANDTVTTEGSNQSRSGTVTDQAGNSASTTVNGINIDKTAPVINASRTPAANANGWNNSDVTVSYTCSDALSGLAGTCPADDSVTTEGANQSSTGNVTDQAGNSATKTVNGINIDKTAPSVALVGGPSNGSSYDFGSVPNAPTCSASDALSGLDGSCTVSGYSNAVGTHTVTATAKDKAANTNTASSTYTVKPYNLSGFYQPIDKNGLTVPVKFELFQSVSGTELTSTSAVTSIKSNAISCSALTGEPEDAIETVATGGTSLRYDATAGQFIYNWTTPKGTNQVGKCYSLTMTAADSSTITAYFKLK